MDWNLLHPLLVVLSIFLMSDLILMRDTPCRDLSNTNVPDGGPGNLVNTSTPRECTRQCVEGELPKICLYRFTVEFFTVLGGACLNCTWPNNTNSISTGCQYVTADGYERGILTVNRMMPGQNIDVCKGDKIVVDIRNRMTGIETTVHWHGMFQRGTQYFDGVPMVTQCPIPAGTTFRYEFYADHEGTHFWHAHDAAQKMDGIQGKMIIRVPQSQDINGDYYDFDLVEHEMLLSDWMHEYSIEHYPGLIKKNPGQTPVSVLFNGMGRWMDPTTGNTTTTPIAQFNVQPGYRYRFRIINAFCGTCPAELIFEGHNLILITVDGEPVQHKEITTIISFAGERVDVIIETNQPPGDYWIHLRALGVCAGTKVQQLAVLHYSGDHRRTTSKQPTYDSSLPKGVTLNPLDGICDIPRPNAVCYTQLTSARPVDERILQATPDMRLYLSATVDTVPIARRFNFQRYDRFIVIGGNPAVAAVNNITHIMPPSPPLTQIRDLPPGTFCSENNLPGNCSSPCPCPHLVDIPLNSVVEVVVTDAFGVNGLFHPFHLHGYTYNVIAMGKAPYKNVKRMNAGHARRMEREGLIHRRLNAPPHKDTMAVPTGGYAIFRFIADNPGYWLLHCHFVFHQIAGMELIFHVGNDKTDLPPTPANFPTCGNYTPPISPVEY